MTSAPPVRLGIVGSGFVVAMFLDALKHVRNHEVTALAARRPESARDLAQRHGIPVVVTSAQELAARDDVDAVVVGVPQDAHHDTIRTVAAAGKAVICTKPLGRDAAEAAQILQTVVAAGVWHGYAETAVFSPAVVKAKAMAESGALGRILTVRAREAHGNPHKHAREPERMGGGPLRGLGCHGVAVGRYFLAGATPVAAFAWGDRLGRDDVACEDNAVMLVRFDDGRLVQVEAGWTHVAGLDIRREIHGSKGWIGLDETSETGLRAFAGAPLDYVMEKAGSNQGWLTPVLDEPVAYGYHGQFDHFVECLRDGGRGPRQSFVDGYIDNAVIDAGYRSMRSGVWENIDLSALESQD